MMEDGHVTDLCFIQYHTYKVYFTITGKVKPRTKEVDPQTKSNHYKTWAMLTSNSLQGSVLFRPLHMQRRVRNQFLLLLPAGYEILQYSLLKTYFNGEWT